MSNINKHFKVSIIKSLIRILGCVAACILVAFNHILYCILTLGISLSIAELLGILEEIMDERK